MTQFVARDLIHNQIFPKNISGQLISSLKKKKKFEKKKKFWDAVNFIRSVYYLTISTIFYIIIYYINRDYYMTFSIYQPRYHHETPIS